MAKLKSFTIIELMMSLLISSIVISISYYAIVFFNIQFNHYKNKSATINSFLLFKKAMQNDFDKSGFIIDSPGSDIMLFDVSKNKKISEYSFRQQYIVRNNISGTDTFNLKNNVHEIEYVSDSLRIVKALHLIISLDSTDIEPVFIKSYTSQELIFAEKTNNE
jgi:hypothetical protein